MRFIGHCLRWRAAGGGARARGEAVESRNTKGGKDGSPGSCRTVRIQFEVCERNVSGSQGRRAVFGDDEHYGGGAGDLELLAITTLRNYTVVVFKRKWVLTKCT